MTEPKLTVFLHTPDNYATIATTVRHLQMQAIAQDIELLVITCDSADLSEAEFPQGAFHSVRIVRMADHEPLVRFRSEAMRIASTPYVACCEDHAFPEPEWAAAAYEAIQGPCAAVGPEMVNANPSTTIRIADMPPGFAPWYEPIKPGPVGRLPGHNIWYKRDILLKQCGDTLDDYMDTKTLVCDDLFKKGYSLCVPPNAHLHHVNFSTFRGWLPKAFLAGRLYGGTRAKEWRRGRRLLYALGSPLIPLLQLRRLYLHMVRSEERLRRQLQIVPVLVLGLCFGAMGEFVGYLTGVGNQTATKVSRLEVKRIEQNRKAERVLIQQRQNFLDDR